MKYLIIILSVLLLTACKDGKKNVLFHNSTDSLHVAKESETLGSASAKILVGTILIPKEIKEYSCYFAANKTDFENGKYIYADDANKTAYMMLDGKNLSMNLISSIDMEADDLLTKEIENDNYKISIKGKKIKGEEYLLFEGTLTIEKSDGNIFATPIYGECGYLNKRTLQSR